MSSIADYNAAVSTYIAKVDVEKAKIDIAMGVLGGYDGLKFIREPRMFKWVQVGKVKPKWHVVEQNISNRLRRMPTLCGRYHHDRTDTNYHDMPGPRRVCRACRVKLTTYLVEQS
jgi:hypothetical protein